MALMKKRPRGGIRQTANEALSYRRPNVALKDFLTC